MQNILWAPKSLKFGGSQLWAWHDMLNWLAQLQSTLGREISAKKQHLMFISTAASLKLVVTALRQYYLVHQNMIYKSLYQQVTWHLYKDILAIW